MAMERRQDSIKHVKDSIRIAEHAATVAKNNVRNRERVVVIRRALPDTLKPVLDSMVATHAANEALLRSDIDSLKIQNIRLIRQLAKADTTMRDLDRFNKTLAKDLAKAYNKSKLSTLEKAGLVVTHVGAFALGALTQ